MSDASPRPAPRKVSAFRRFFSPLSVDDRLSVVTQRVILCVSVLALGALALLVLSAVGCASTREKAQEKAHASSTATALALRHAPPAPMPLSTTAALLTTDIVARPTVHEYTLTLQIATVPASPDALLALRFDFCGADRGVLSAVLDGNGRSSRAITFTADCADTAFEVGIVVSGRYGNRPIVGSDLLSIPAWR